MLDSFDGEVITEEMLFDPEKLKTVDLQGFMQRNSKEARGPAVHDFARKLKAEMGFKKVGAVGYCWGGWAAFQLGANGMLIEHFPLHTTVHLYSLFVDIHVAMEWLELGVAADIKTGKNLIDALSVAHPTFLTKEEIDDVAVPVQILAPETDPRFTPELKEHANRVIPTLGVEYDYQYFPGLAHGFSCRADENDEKEKRGLERAKNAVSGWFGQMLQGR